MENKIDIKFDKDHYVNESDSLKEILDASIGIGNKLTFTDGFRGFSCITKVTDDEINITKLNPPHYKSLSPAYERIKSWFPSVKADFICDKIKYKYFTPKSFNILITISITSFFEKTYMFYELHHDCLAFSALNKEQQSVLHQVNN